MMNIQKREMILQLQKTVTRALLWKKELKVAVWFI